MVGQKKEVGATGEAVARNVKRLREAANLTYTEVSKALVGVDRPISPLAVRRIEEMERRVDVDDLLALAVVLGVSPVSLLYPGASEAEEPVAATGWNSAVSARHLWEWMCVEVPQMAGKDEIEKHAFLGAAMPEWRRREFSEEIRERTELAAKRFRGRSEAKGVQGRWDARLSAVERGAAGERGPDGDD